MAASAITVASPSGMTARASAPAARRGSRQRLLIALCVLVVTACPAVCAVSSGGDPAGGVTAKDGAGWSAVPLAARALVSATVGASEPSFRVHRSAAGALMAVNRGQRLQANFSATEARVTSTGGGWLGLRLASVSGTGGSRGMGGSSGLGTTRLTGGGDRVSYAYQGISESFTNGPLGLEQSFTIAGHARGQIAHGPVVVSMALSGDLRARLAGAGVTFSRGGRPVLAYRDLLVRDATGRRIPARLALADGRVEVRIDARRAVFPLRVDPFLQSAELTESEGDEYDQFGYSLGVSGDGSTVVAGAPGRTVDGDSYAGAVYVFTDTAGTWAQSAELTITGGASNDQLGSSVAVSSDASTIVAGAVGYSNSRGAVYVFTGNATSGWTQSAGPLTASDGASYDDLGQSVAVSADGSTLVAGAAGHTPSGGDSGQGAAYVFSDSTGTWSQSAELIASTDVGSDARLGWSVAISADGSTVAAGAPLTTPSGEKDEAGAVYVFTDTGGTWSQSDELSVTGGSAAGQLGLSVAMSGDGSTIVSGAPGDGDEGEVFVFTGNATDGWTQSGELTTGGDTYDEFGNAVGISANGSTVVAGAYYQTVGSNAQEGAVYVFTDLAGDQTTPQELTASDGTEDDYLGTSVAISATGSTIVAGSPYHTVDGNDEQGAAYVFMPSVGVTTTTTTTTPVTTTTTATTTVPVTTSTTATTTTPVTTTTTATTTTPVTSTTTQTTSSPVTSTTTVTSTAPTTSTAVVTATSPTTVTSAATTTQTVAQPCSQTSRFITHILTKHITGREIKLTGIAEAKCPDHITKIGIALAHFDKGRCSFLNPDHKFAPYGTCTPHDYLKANGTSHWTYTLHHTFTRGVYHLWEHATNNQHQSTHNTAARHVYFWAG